jgi:transcriptional regulator with GAF, ATPase, and Fis domain
MFAGAAAGDSALVAPPLSPDRVTAIVATDLPRAEPAAIDDPFTRALAAARAEAEVARADAVRARAEAEAARVDAERARAEADAARADAEQARAEAEEARAELDAVVAERRRREDALPELGLPHAPVPSLAASDLGASAPVGGPHRAFVRLPRTIDTVEREYVARMLEETDWIIEGDRGAARRLGLHPNTLRSRMKRWGLKRPSNEVSAAG